MRFSAGMVRRSRPSVSPCCARCRAAADDSGYEIDEAEVIYWGRCPECVAATSVSSGELKPTRNVQHQLGDTALDPEQPGSRATGHHKETLREEKERRV